MRHVPLPRDARGVTLIETMVALVVFAIGVVVVAGLFPAGQRGQLQDRMRMTANMFAQEKIEQLGHLDWSDAQITVGRHPAGTATEACGASSAWRRWYQVSTLAAPLDNLRKIVVTVEWTTTTGVRSTSATTYVRR
jgi:prepilin-type N-terminal cleavage/methylation domain-containing protein